MHWIDTLLISVTQITSILRFIQYFIFHNHFFVILRVILVQQKDA